MVFTFIVVSLVTNTQLASAHHKKAVLGETTEATDVNFPPVSSGPGLILPDSPFYFLDHLKQNTRLFFAFGNDDKARVRAAIAGERLSELRIMMVRADTDGINTALDQLARENRLAAEHLGEAQAEGKDVEELAMEINTSIKQQREILGIAEEQSSGELRIRFELARQSLRESKIEVEDALPEDELQKEIEDALYDVIEEDLEDAQGSSKRLERALAVLTEQASKSAGSNLSRRQEALQKAIENKNETLRRLEERRLSAELEKQEKIAEEQEKAAEEVQKASENVEKAAQRVREAQQRLQEAKNESIDVEGLDKVEEEDENGSNSNTNRGSGSQNSESN